MPFRRAEARHLLLRGPDSPPAEIAALSPQLETLVRRDDRIVARPPADEAAASLKERGAGGGFRETSWRRREVAAEIRVGGEKRGAPGFARPASRAPAGPSPRRQAGCPGQRKKRDLLCRRDRRHLPQDAFASGDGRLRGALRAERAVPRTAAGSPSQRSIRMWIFRSWSPPSPPRGNGSWMPSQ